PPSLWKLSGDGKTETKVFEFDREWKSCKSWKISAELSPNGRYMALGNDNGILQVLDLGERKVLWTIKDIPLPVMYISPRSPRLQFTWMDNDRLRFSETANLVGRRWENAFFQWVDVRARNGKRLKTYPYTESLASEHVKPSPGVDSLKETFTEGLFDGVWGKHFFYRGEKESITDALAKGKTREAGDSPWSFQVSPDGRWAVLSSVTHRGSLHL